MQFPHCDSSILHAPKTCSYCDEHPDWQELREMWRINFTGGTDSTKAPCPSERLRPAYIAHRWPGNRPTMVDVPLTPPSSYDRINDPDYAVTRCIDDDDDVREDTP
jgi:hypothetical protein